MRRSSDLSVDRPRRRISGRGILIGLGGLFLFVLIFGRAIARFYVDYLWHDALGRSDVFWGVLSAKATLFVVFFLAFVVIAGLNLFIADRAAPTHFPANVHPYVERFHELFGQRLRIVRYGIAVLFALLLALPAVALWQDWLLFRNAREFGIADAEFSADVGFYIFQLPFLSFVLNWLFAALIVVLLLTAAAHILNGGVVFVSPVPVVRQATKAHLAVLLAVLAVVKAGDYWLDRYDVTNNQTGIVQGATYSVVNAQLPAIMLLILIALLTAGLYLSVVKTGSFRMPLIASALWLVVALVGGVIYPAVVQALVVNPNQQEREQPFIERNVNATREALNLTDVDVRTVSFGSLTATDVEDDIAPLENVRLLNPVQMESRFLVDRGEVAGLTIDDLDVDRYVLEDSRDGDPEEVLVAARELDLAGVTNKSWQGLHLINTRGCGLVLAPAGRVLESQRPDYRTVELERPELYFSEILTGYAIANTSSTERECSEPHEYEGTMGVEMSSFTRRAAFALAFLDYNVLGFGGINDDSQMLWVRGINDRLEKLAPFLSYDADPYPVAVDGRVVWVTDAYTTSSRYPYGQRIGDVQRSPQSGLDDNDNYVRNSVKAVVDAYTGDVKFYVVDEQDPILRAWRGAFPDLFTPFNEMPEELIDNLRYPEDLFRIQTDVYSKYRIAPDQFFQRVGAWSVAQAPGTEPTQTAVPTASRRWRRHPDRRAEHLRRRVERRSVHPVLHAVQHRDAGTADQRGVRDPPSVRAVLDERSAHRAAGVHDGVERARDVWPADDLHRRGGRRSAPGRPVASRRSGRVDRGDLATHLARQRGRRRDTGRLRRPPADPGRRWTDLCPAVLRVGPAELRSGGLGDRVPGGDRVVQRSLGAGIDGDRGPRRVVPRVRERCRRRDRRADRTRR